MKEREVGKTGMLNGMHQECIRGRKEQELGMRMKTRKEEQRKYRERLGVIGEF